MTIRQALLDSVVEHVGRVCVSVSDKSSAKSTH